VKHEYFERIRKRLLKVLSLIHSELVMIQEVQIFVVSFSRYGAITFLRIFDFNNNSYVVLFGFVGGIDILAVFQIQIVAWLINYYFCFCHFFQF